MASAIIDTAKDLVGEGKPFDKILAVGKVRDLYELDNDTLLFIATDRISAFDVVLENGIPEKGALLTKMSAFWFEYLSSKIPGLKTHLVSLGLPAEVKEQLSAETAAQLSKRAMVVQKLEIFPIESIVRGYITGGAWKEYQTSGKVHEIPIEGGMRESGAFTTDEGKFKPIWTPSTKAPAGEKDENISPKQAATLVGGEETAQKIEKLSIELYQKAHDYALKRGITIADTKFEFGSTPAGDIVLVDEVLTPDSSRFWPADKYESGHSQESYDKQYLRDWLTRKGLKGKEGISIPDEVAAETSKKYKEVVELLTSNGTTLA